MKRTVLTITLIALGLHLLIPTPDETFVYIPMGYATADLLNIELNTGILIFAVTYHSLGAVLLIAAWIVGGKRAFNRIKSMLTKGKFILKVKQLFNR